MQKKNVKGLFDYTTSAEVLKDGDRVDMEAERGVIKKLTSKIILYFMERENIWAALKESEESKKERTKAIFEGFFSQMQELNLIPKAFYVKSEPRDLQTIETITELKRPFGVFEVERKQQMGESFIYKAEVPSVESKGMDREVAFYKTLVPEVVENINHSLRDEIIFPDMYETYFHGETPKGIVIQKLEGRMIGTHDKTYPGVIDERDLDRIIEIIRAVQKINPQKARELAPSLPELDYQEIETIRLQEKKVDIVRILGEEAYKKAESLAQESFQYEAQQSMMLLSEDIFQTNLMKLPDGKLGLFDWERLHTGKNPADDYGKIVSRLWSEAELQEKMIKKVLERNKDIEGFKEMFRFNLFIREVFHLLKHYHKILEEFESDPKKFESREDLIKEAREGKEAMMRMSKDIFNDLGPWSDNKNSVKVTTTTL